MVIPAIECDSVLKRKEILTRAMTQMKLEEIMLSEQASHKRRNIAWFLLYKLPRILMFIKTERKIVVSRASGEEGMGVNV